MNVIKKTPIAISGLMLALFSIGKFLEKFTNHISLIFGIIAFVILLLLVLKLVCYPDMIRKEYDNLIVASTSGTFSMALMMFSTYFTDFNYYLSLGIWIMGVILHSLLIVYFTRKYIFNIKLEDVYTSYFIVYIGITMASITGAKYMGDYNYIFFLFGFLSMIPNIIAVVYRYILIPVKMDKLKPLICIFTAIYSILIVGYFHSFSNISENALIITYIICLIFFILSVYKFIEYRNLDFYPTYSAFSFPFVITANATYLMYTLFNNEVLYYILIIESVVAVYCVCYVLYYYVKEVYI